MRLVPYAAAPLGADLELFDDGLNTPAMPPVLCVTDEGTHLLLERSDGPLELRALDRQLTLIEAIPSPNTRAFGQATLGAASVAARRALWIDGSMESEPGVSGTAVMSFGDAEITRLRAAAGVLKRASRTMDIDGESVHGALFGEDGVLWLALTTRRCDDVTLYVARVAAGERGIRHPLVIGAARAGSAYQQTGFGPVRLTRAGAGRVELSIGSTSGELEHARVTVAWTGRRLVEQAREAGSKVPGAFAWPPELRAGGAPPTPDSLPGLDEVLSVLEVGQEHAAELEIVLPWETPRAVLTPDGPGLLVVGADDEGLLARIWLLR